MNTLILLSIIVFIEVAALLVVIYKNMNLRKVIEVKNYSKYIDWDLSRDFLRQRSSR